MSDEYSLDATTRELIDDCLVRLASGEACAAFDLANVFMSHAEARDIGLNLALIEALAINSKTAGCPEAGVFLDSQWPDMKNILRKRWMREGLT